MFNGKVHDVYGPFAIAMLNCQRVTAKQTSSEKHAAGSFPVFLFYLFSTHLESFAKDCWLVGLNHQIEASKAHPNHFQFWPECQRLPDFPRFWWSWDQAPGAQRSSSFTATKLIMLGFKSRSLMVSFCFYINRLLLKPVIYGEFSHLSHKNGDFQALCEFCQKVCNDSVWWRGPPNSPQFSADSMPRNPTDQRCLSPLQYASGKNVGKTIGKQ